MFHIRIAACAVLVFFACRPDASPLHAQVAVRGAFPVLSFTKPVDIQHAGDGSGRLFIVEQAGVIRVIAGDSTTMSAPVFLDIRARVQSSGNEQGLLGLAFHPKYAENGYFYVNYTASSPERTVIARFSRSATDPNVADASSGTVLLEFAQPYSNHNGGQIAFGADGFLYIATGDGGSGGDPQGNAQNRRTLLGKILRIDVDRTQGTLAYAIPDGNPYKNNDAGLREEIWAYGLRNPWRFSFDPATGELWTGDVGQSRREEIDIIRAGGNYGWNTMEASLCYSPQSNCDTTGLILPIWEYPRTAGVSVTGGHVYRGAAVPALAGEYVYADFGTGTIWGLRRTPGGVVNRTLVATGRNISTFGVDERGELYFASFDGRISRFVSTVTSVGDGAAAHAADLRITDLWPQPLTSGGSLPSLAFELVRTGTVEALVTDVLGRIMLRADLGVRAPGAHTVQLDLAGLAPGAYRCTLAVGTTRTSRALLVSR